MILDLMYAQIHLLKITCLGMSFWSSLPKRIFVICFSYSATQRIETANQRPAKERHGVFPHSIKRLGSRKAWRYDVVVTPPCSVMVRKPGNMTPSATVMDPNFLTQPQPMWSYSLPPY